MSNALCKCHIVETKPQGFLSLADLVEPRSLTSSHSFFRCYNVPHPLRGSLPAQAP